MSLTDKEIALELTKATLDYFANYTNVKPINHESIKAIYGNYYHEVANLKNTVLKKQP